MCCQPPPPNIILEILNSAFAGAVFSLISGYLLYRYSKKHELWMLHKKSTVSTVELMPRHLNEMYDNLYLMEGDIVALEKGGFTYNELHPLPMPDYKTDFQNIELKNKFLDYETEIIKLNHDMEAINRAIHGLWDAMISGNLDANSALINRTHLIAQLRTVHIFLNMAIEKTFTFGSYLRVFMKKDKFDFWGNLEKTNHIKVEENEILRERILFVSESENTKEKSKSKIEKIQENEYKNKK
ncbi:MAG: hypothetical protein M3Q44_06705 [bacterium]|nr:hypothetical protein [bacterium]